jgi:hypothetical protein
MPVGRTCLRDLGEPMNNSNADRRFSRGDEVVLMGRGNVAWSFTHGRRKSLADSRTVTSRSSEGASPAVSHLGFRMSCAMPRVRFAREPTGPGNRPPNKSPARCFPQQRIVRNPPREASGSHPEPVLAKGGRWLRLLDS